MNWKWTQAMWREAYARGTARGVCRDRDPLAFGGRVRRRSRRRDPAQDRVTKTRSGSRPKAAWRTDNAVAELLQAEHARCRAYSWRKEMTRSYETKGRTFVILRGTPTMTDTPAGTVEDVTEKATQAG